MRDMKIRKMVLAALMAALTYVATMVVQIPSPMQGFVNLGDCCVLLSGWILGPWWGGAAAGIGSMLTDLLNGYAHYAPGTLVIKALDAMAAALIVKALGRKPYAYVVGGVVGGGHHGGGLFRLCLPAAGQGHRRGGQHPRQPGAGGHGPGHWPGAVRAAQAQQGSGQAEHSVVK